MSDWKEQSLAVLRNLNCGPVHEFSRIDFGRERNNSCVSTIVKQPGGFFAGLFKLVANVGVYDASKKRAIPIVERLRKELPANTVCFIGTTRWLGDYNPGGAEIVVGPGSDQLEIIRYANTEPINYDMNAEALMAKIRDIDSRFGVDIVHAETDTLEFKLKSLPDDLEAFANEIYELCPDIVDQGCESTEALAEIVKKSGSVYLWWD